MTDEDRLRTSLRADAREAEPAPDLPERILTAARSQADLGPARPAWRNWIFPVVAALIVGILVGSVLVMKNLFPATKDTANHPTPNSADVVITPPTTAPDSPATSGPPTTASTPPSTLPAGPVGGPVPTGFHAVDLTWVSDTNGWALGTAPCAHAPCTSLLRTTNGGQSWVGIAPPVIGLSGDGSCDSNCGIRHVRFITPLIGYLYGPGVLFSTTDGGTSWQRQSGGAYALEGNRTSVLRVTAAVGCAPGCQYALQRSVPGSSSWTDVALPASSTSGAVRVELVRTAGADAIAFFGHTSGGAQSAQTTLLTSTSGGTSWVNRGEPCPQAGAAGAPEVDSTELTSAADGSLTVLCRLRASGALFTATSADSGVHFTSGPDSPGAGTVVIGAASAQILLAVSDSIYRSTNGGRSYARVETGASAEASDTDAAQLFFQDASTGRFLPADGKAVWVTTDAGAHWIKQGFG